MPKNYIRMNRNYRCTLPVDDGMLMELSNELAEVAKEYPGLVVLTRGNSFVDAKDPDKIRRMGMFHTRGMAEPGKNVSIYSLEFSNGGDIPPEYWNRIRNVFRESQAEAMGV